MVVFTVVTTSNPCTVNFEKPVTNVNGVRLLSCSLYNSWHNLKRKGQISLFDPDGKAATPVTFLEGDYTLTSMAKEKENVFEKEGVKSPTEINTPVGAMVIKNLRLRKYVSTMT